MSANNKYGLPRDISSKIKKAVRRRCGFGCVICGNAIITYEHVEPTFANARIHDPQCITLLCGGHQLESSKGTLSKETILQADRAPYCKGTGQAKHIFDLGGKKPTLLLGGNDFSECGHSIQIDGQTLFEILPTDKHSSRW